ncbi:MAG: hypothetical protein IPP19_01055 [Verrucomicrobia bacterium]|nr:hypothetical protein [Verrucomicrobiota bacterium]
MSQGTLADRSYEFTDPTIQEMYTEAEAAAREKSPTTTATTDQRQRLPS